MVFDCKICTCCLKLWSSELDTDDAVEFFLIEPPEAKTMGAIAQGSPEAKTMGAIVQKSQNHGSYRSKRNPRGHLDEAPMEMGLP